MDVKIGDSFSTKRHVTDELVRKFADVSGDYNPIHLDEEFARTTRFGKRIAHGMLSGAFISAVLGSEFKERKLPVTNDEVHRPCLPRRHCYNYRDRHQDPRGPRHRHSRNYLHKSKRPNPCKRRSRCHDPALNTIDFSFDFSVTAELFNRRWTQIR
jgi:hypothetical protein